MDQDLRTSTIKISGCPNSCGQHEVATIGFYGGATRLGNSMAPIYTMLFAGSSGEKGELGKVVMRVPAKRVIDVIIKIIECYREEKEGKETMHDWITKISVGHGNGKIKNLEDIKKILVNVIKLPSFADSPDSYKDYGSDSNFIAKTARGECAA
jgi:sulfite reductase (ferredoxin)